MSSPLQTADLLICDDMLPSDFSPFRTIEYGHYLSFFDCVLLSIEGWNIWASNESFAAQLHRLPIDPALKTRIARFSEVAPDIVARLGYVTFLGNATRFLPYFESRQLPFILQLYPGGGFGLHQPESDEKLRRVLHSPLCRKVIVTQSVTRDYVTRELGCDPAKVALIFGGVYESRIDFDFGRDKKHFGKDKETIDLCFVAHKYGDDLTSKGYTQFVAIANLLAATDARLRFHVVGEYREGDVPLGEAAGVFTFYGRRPSDFFATFYPGMDAIVSINKPFALAPGAFDGFPTGACIEAGLHGVLNCLSDPLQLNPAFVDGDDIVLLDDDAARSAGVLRGLIADMPALYAMAERNWRSFRRIFDTDRQLWFRTRLIAAELTRHQGLIVSPRTTFSELHTGPASAAFIELQQNHEAYHNGKTNEIAALKDDLAGRGNELAAVRGELAAANDRLAAARGALSDREQQLAEARSELARITSSVSWRALHRLHLLLSRHPYLRSALRRLLQRA